MLSGDRIRKLRNARGYSLRDMAVILEMTPSHISKIERNERGTSVEMLDVISKHFKVTVDYLMGKVDDPQLTVETKIKIEEETKELYDILEKLPPERRKEIMDKVLTYVKIEHPDL
ncbi:helix-turn-helix transcriptional regulator [Cytobacillus sp. IB215665]|uniref:helix-turn-helix domain-containing protein n=1 Tax=Cytobacillus sp. IB215665 TaxID=3097357 RepID=UPI002A1816C4|nr:helix-turn-helix transcriptional regulator [Cytobacillus sp. IB215665]MDX8367883.1 helix-turn-helix transcriptional regulator [Cytobacillus sp. IB215665]